MPAAALAAVPKAVTLPLEAIAARLAALCGTRASV
jgi:hypothetical protein